MRRAFRATEAALGVAASELFAALPKEYREQLAELPAIVAALEARAAEARAEIDVVAALAPSGSVDAEVLAARKKAAAAHLAESVAALEGIRLDLLRLHAGAARSRAAHDADGRRARHWRGRESTRGGAAGSRGRRTCEQSKQGEGSEQSLGRCGDARTIHQSSPRFSAETAFAAARAVSAMYVMLGF